LPTAAAGAAAVGGYAVRLGADEYRMAAVGVAAVGLAAGPALGRWAYRRLPARWPERRRQGAAVGLAIPLVGAQVFAGLFVFVYGSLALWGLE
jgi:hypothetical protein